METEIEIDPHGATLSLADDDDTNVKESDETASETNAGDEDEVEEQLKAAIIEMAGGSIYAYMLDPNVRDYAFMLRHTFLPPVRVPVKLIFVMVCCVQIVGVIGIGISANSHLEEDAGNQLQCTKGTNGTLTATCFPQLELENVFSSPVVPSRSDFSTYSVSQSAVLAFMEIFLIFWVQSDIRLAHAMITYSNLIHHTVLRRANGQKSEGASEGEAARKEIDFRLIGRTGWFVIVLAILVVFANLLACNRTFDAGGTTFDAGLNALTFLIILDIDERFAWLFHLKSLDAATAKLKKLDFAIRNSK